MKTQLKGDQNESFLTFKNKQNDHTERTLFIVQVIVSNLLFVLFMIHLLSFFQWEDMSVLIFIPGIILNCIFFFLSNRQRTLMIGIYLLLLSAVFIIFHSYIVNGLFIILNDLFELIGRNTGIMITPYEVNVPAESYHLAIQFMLMYLGILLSLLSYYLVKKNQAILLWLFFVMLFALQSKIQLEGMLIVNMISVWIGIYVSFKAIYKKTAMQGSSKVSVYGAVFLYVLLVSVLITVLLFTYKPFNDYEASNITNSVQNQTKQSMNDFRYEKNQTNNFTEGNFTNISKLKLRHEPALEVIMEKPTSVYLRGFTGAVYTSEQWEELDSETHYENNDLFYWLNEEDFHPLNQLSSINELIDDETLLNKTTMTIHNMQASSKYLYTPYELITNINDFEQVRPSSNQTMVSSSFFGDRFYQFESYENLVIHYPTLANYLYGVMEEGEGKAYKNNEGHYNEFVYDTYTDIPENIELMLNHHFEKIETTDSHIAYERAISHIKGFVARNISYNLDPEALPQDKDFLVHVLEDSREGYATHYATVATLLFRYLDIPARYVEGYLVTPKDIKDKEAYEKIIIDGTNAHAWTEIYIDQVGWIPVEMTPPYYNVMEQTDISNYPKGIEDSEEDNELEEKMNESSGSKKVKDEEDREVINKKEKENETSIVWSKYVTYIGLTIIILLLLIGIVYFINKRLSIRKLIQSFYNPNPTIATSKLFSYVMYVLHYDGLQRRGSSTYSNVEDVCHKYGEAYADRFTQAITLNQIAIYSQQDMTEEERQLMLDFMQETLANIKKSKNIFQRMKMRYWDFIY